MFDQQEAVSPAKPPESPNEEVDDPLYLMTLTIPQLFLKPLQVMWDATILGVFNQNSCGRSEEHTSELQSPA